MSAAEVGVASARVTAAAGDQHHGAVGFIVIGAILFLILAWWAIWPRSVIAFSDWLRRFRWLDITFKNRDGTSVQASERQLRIGSGVGLVVAAALMAIGLVRLQ